MRNCPVTLDSIRLNLKTTYLKYCQSILQIMELKSVAIWNLVHGHTGDRGPSVQQLVVLATDYENGNVHAGESYVQIMPIFFMNSKFRVIKLSPHLS